MRMPLFGKEREALERRVKELEEDLSIERHSRQVAETICEEIKESKRDLQVPALLARIKALQERDPQSEALAIANKRCDMLQDIANNHAKQTDRLRKLRELIMEIDPQAIAMMQTANESVVDVAIRMIQAGRKTTV